MTTHPDHYETHIANGSESLREFAFNAGMDNPTHCWLLDGRDVWVKNPFFEGKEEAHPEDYPHDDEEPALAAPSVSTATDEEIPF